LRAMKLDFTKYNLQQCCHVCAVKFGTKTGRARSQHGAPCMMHAPWHTSVQNGSFVQKQHSCIPRRHETYERTTAPAFEDEESKNYFIMSLRSAAAAVPCQGLAVQVQSCSGDNNNNNAPLP
jgi:hypothetical protein